MKQIRLELDALEVQTFATGSVSSWMNGAMLGMALAQPDDSKQYPGCITEVRTDIMSDCFPDMCK